MECLISNKHNRSPLEVLAEVGWYFHDSLSFALMQICASFSPVHFFYIVKTHQPLLCQVCTRTKIFRKKNKKYNFIEKLLASLKNFETLFVAMTHLKMGYDFFYESCNQMSHATLLIKLTQLSIMYFNLKFRKF